MFLQRVQDLVVEAGIVVVRPAQQHDAEPVLALEPVNDLAMVAL